MGAAALLLPCAVLAYVLCVAPVSSVTLIPREVGSALQPNNFTRCALHDGVCPMRTGKGGCPFAKVGRGTGCVVCWCAID